MTESDFERFKDYRLSDKRFQYAPRKRVPHNGHRTVVEEETRILLNGGISSGPSEPDFSDVLKDYDTDTDDSEERERELEMLRMQANVKPLIGQGATYLFLLAFIGVFVLLVNWYNMKQLAHLKEEYGHDERRPSPEFWWRKAVIYHIYVHSFQDSDGDGIGDLNGIRQQLDYLSYLGVDAILLSAFYDSPFEHLGQDVRDFMAVSSRYGTIHDFELLAAELHQRGMKLAVEVTPNHTSRRHKWFVQSCQSTSNPHSDYYIWSSGRRSANGSTTAPNNWVSLYGGSAWTFDSTRQQYYYHYYHSSMPDLNLRHPDVRHQLLEVFKFWLDRGVDGLMIKDVHVMFESDDVTLDEPADDDIDLFPGVAGDLLSSRHIYTEGQPDVHDFLGSWRDFVETYSVQSERRIGLMVSSAATVVSEVVKFYFTGADVPVAPTFLRMSSLCNARCVHEAVDTWLTHVPEEYDALWMLSSAEERRMSNRKGAQFQTALNVLTLLLPGGTVSYYGEEIGLSDMDITHADVMNYASKLAPTSRGSIERALSRSPMLWSSDKHAGFTAANSPWLPVHSAFRSLNVQTQRNDVSGRSPVQVFQRLTRLRKERSFLSNKLQFLLVNDNVLSFMRYARDGAPYLIALNLGNESSTNDYTMLTGMAHGKVVLYSGQWLKVRDGDVVALSDLQLQPGDAIVTMLVVDDTQTV